MNDFTREELADLAAGAGWMWSELAGCVDDDVIEGWKLLEKKVSKMIAHYCEHEPSDAHYEQFRWQLCSKCGVQYK